MTSRPTPQQFDVIEGDIVRKIGGIKGVVYTVVEVLDGGDLVRTHREGYTGVYTFQRHELSIVSRPTRIIPTPDPISPTAFKADDGKDRFDLLMTKEGCASAVADVVKVLSFAVRPKDQGGKGYVPHSWREAPEGRRRYLSAMYRHLAAIERGEEVDDESGLPHLAHVATNALFLLEFHKDAK